MRLQKNEISPFRLFLALSLVCLILFALMMPWLGQKGMDWVVMENNSDFEAADYTLCQLFALCGCRGDERSGGYRHDEQQREHERDELL